MTTSTTVNPGVVTFVIIRCTCGKTQGPSASVGSHLTFWCNDRGCGRWNDVVVR